MRRAGSDLWLPLALGAFVTPALILATARPEVVYPRYFLVNVLLLQFRQGRSGKLVYGAALAAMLAGNAALTVRLLEHGRGGYQAALQYMLARTSGDELTVGSDHDFRNSLVLHYYYRRSGSEKRLVYYPRDEWPATGPEWVLTQNPEPQFSPPKVLRDPSGNAYRLEAVFPYAGLSGWHWAVYQKGSQK
jgi:hypothetical protein